MKKVVVWISAILLVFCAIYFAELAYLEYEPVIISQTQADIVKEVAVVVDDSNDPYNRVIDFDTLKEINEDIVGWVYIPGTSVDYPILIGDTDDEYLNKDMNGNSNSLGSIFSYSSTSKDLTDARTVLLGHNMRYHQMFGELKKYMKDDSYRASNTKMYIYTEKRTIESSLFSIFVCNESDDLLWKGADISSGAYQDLLCEINERNQCLDVNLDGLEDMYNNQSFSLATCWGSSGTSDRLIVSFIEVREKYILD